MSGGMRCGLGLMPSLMAVKPWGVVYFSPLRAGRCSADGYAFEFRHHQIVLQLGVQSLQALRRSDVLPRPVYSCAEQRLAAMERSNSGFKGNAPSVQPAKNARR